MAYEGLPVVRYESFSIARVPPKYRFAWEGMYAAIPGWQTGGTVAEMVTGITGTFSGTAGFVNGYQGAELNFAASSYVTFGNRTEFGVPLYGSVTHAVIHSPASTQETATMVYADISSAMEPFLMRWSKPSTSQYCFHNDNAAHGPNSGSVTFAVGSRNFVVGRRVGDHAAGPTCTLFVNGRMLGETTGTLLDPEWNLSNNTPILAINREGNWAAGNMGPGTMSNIMTWNRALSDAEIEALSDDPYGPFRQLRQDYVFLFRYIQPSSYVLSPEAIVSSTNLTGSVAAIQDDPDASDATWLTATSATAATDLLISFPTPAVEPDGQQTFNCRVRKTAGATVPTLNAELLQAGTLRKVLTRNVPISSTTGENVELLWRDTDLVSVLDGSDVELRLYSNVGFTNFEVGSTPAYSSTGPLLVSSAFLTYNEVTCPAIINAGDLLICQAVTRNEYMDSGATMIQTGWTAFPGNTYGGNTTRVHQSLFWRIADGTEGGKDIIVRTFGNNLSSMALVCIHRFTSTNGFAGTPIENIGLNVGSGTTVTVGRTITPSSVNQLAICTIGLGENFPTFGSMTSETGGDWIQRSHTGSSLESIGMQTADLSAGTAITGGEKVFSETDEYWSALSFCLASAPVGLTGINTIEIGAVEWHVITIPNASDSYVIASSLFS